MPWGSSSLHAVLEPAGDQVDDGHAVVRPVLQQKGADLRIEGKMI
jgi:hypothetical protein